MCGIVGSVSSKPVDHTVLSEMVSSIRHRGPNDQGYLYESHHKKYVFMGHTRLSILDVSEHAHQPMVGANGNVTLIFNGEVYNFIELRSELERLGYTFFSTGDSEVVLNAYLEWGTECFAKFNGMWAIAIYDARSDSLILSRDRFGKKPLYYYHADDTIIFASEIKAILKHPEVVAQPNYRKVYRYLATNYRYIDCDDDSYFEGIQQIPKSSFTILDSNSSMQTKRYWEIQNFDCMPIISEQETIEVFKELLIDSVRIRLRSDVPVGCFLSGGMDSTSITSIAYKVLQTPIMTFSGITGEEKGIYDESEYIHEVIRETHAVSRFIRPDPADIIETVDEMLNFHDEPICTVTWYSLYLISKNIKDAGVPVILNGHGGDELIGGYWDHYQYNFADLEGSASLQSGIDAWQTNHHRDPAEIERFREYLRKLSAGSVTEQGRFPDYSYVFNVSFIQQHANGIVLPSVNSTSWLTRRLHNELFYETVPASLRAEDRNTMSQSIESRSPFLDYRLAEFCFALPNQFKIRDGIGKWILREAMRGILPEKVRTRKDKAGFIAPADEWFRTVNKDQIRAMINSPELSQRNIYNINALNSLFDEHLSGEKNHAMFLWQFINLELWFKKKFTVNNY